MLDHVASNRLKALAQKQNLRLTFEATDGAILARFAYGGPKMARISVDAEAATKLIRAWFPEAKVHSNSGYTIAFVLPLDEAY